MAFCVSTYRFVSAATTSLELLGISKRFGEVVALDAANLQLRRGTVHALLGENGAGKTTLMRIAYGLLKPDAGAVHIDARPIRFHSPADAIQRGIGMVQQHFSLVPAMTAVENFALGNRGRFDPRKESERLLEQAATLQLSIAPDMPAHSMSAPEQQQLEIAKALGRDCRILILDEPTAVLSPMHSAALLQWIRSYADQGRSVVLITHKLRDAAAVADDVTVLRHGRTVLQGRISDIAEAELLAAMLGAPLAQSELTVPRPHRPTSTPPLGSLQSVSAEEWARRERIADVSLEINAAEILGVAGLERSGHRLLLRVLAGRHVPTKGIVRIPPRIAFIPEDRQREALATQLDLRENVALRGAGNRTGWSRWRYWSSLTRALLKDFDVHAVNERVPAHTLSGGNQQRLVLARELADAPMLIVAENPTRGLDARATANLLARLRAARDDGAAIVFYSSDLDELVALADRIVLAYAGRVREAERSRDAIGRALVGTT